MKLNKVLLLVLGLLMPFASLYAQANSDANNQSYKRVYVFDVGLGFNCPDVWGDGGSSWAVDKDKDNCNFVSSMQLMTFSSRSAVGYGLYYYNYKSAKERYDGVLPQEVNEKVAFHYVAPQVSFIKRHTAFAKGVGYVNAGVGYAHYKSKGMLMQKEDYRTIVSGIGCNVGIAYEYVFDSNMGIRLAVDCIYARLKRLHKDKAAYPADLSVRPREKSHLFVPSLELGLSYYIFHQ